MSNELQRIDPQAVQWPAIAEKGPLTEALEPQTLRRTLRKVDTPMKAYESRAPTIAEIQKAHGEKYCMARIAGLLLSLEDYLGAQCDLSKDQYIILTEDIMDRFYMLNMADINLVLQRIRHGESGKIFGKVSLQYLYKAFEDYTQERTATIAESHRASEDSIAKHGYDRSKASGLSDEELEDLYKNYDLEQEAEQERKKLREMDRQYRLKDVLNKVKRYVKNGTKENM